MPHPHFVNTVPVDQYGQFVHGSPAVYGPQGVFGNLGHAALSYGRNLVSHHAHSVGTQIGAYIGQKVAEHFGTAAPTVPDATVDPQGVFGDFARTLASHAKNHLAQNAHHYGAAIGHYIGQKVAEHLGGAAPTAPDATVDPQGVFSNIAQAVASHAKSLIAQHGERIATHIGAHIGKKIAEHVGGAAPTVPDASVAPESIFGDALNFLGQMNPIPGAIASTIAKPFITPMAQSLMGPQAGQAFVNQATRNLTRGHIGNFLPFSAGPLAQASPFQPQSIWDEALSFGGAVLGNLADAYAN